MRADPGLTREYIDLSKRVTEFLVSVLPQKPIMLADNVTDYLYGEAAIKSNAKARGQRRPYSITESSTSSP